MPVSSRPPGIQPASTPAEAHLRPYAFHGVGLAVRGTHAVGDCPFCGREGKLAVAVADGLGRCLVCGTGGDRGGFNPLSFVRLLYERACPPAAQGSPTPGRNGTGGPRAVPGLQDAAGAALGAFLAAVAADRRLLSPATAAAWGVRPCPVDGRTWLVPGYGPDGRLDQVYRRTRVQDKGEWVWRLLPTPGIWPEGKVHALHLPAGDHDPARPDILVCEGPWDGMAFWEASRAAPRAGSTNVIAVPGCNVWRDEWTEFCRGKNVTLMYDSDHPKEYTPGHTSRAGYDGMRRVAKRLSGAAASVRYVSWGPEGFDPAKPSGWDVRDHLGGDANGRPAALAELTSRVADAPREWFSATAAPSASNHTASTEALPCETWGACEAAWRDAMYWRQDLGDAVAVLLAICASTSQSGNQLFLDLIGSPGSAKTTLCQGLLASSNCIHVENMTKLMSGWKKPDDDTKDCSFLARANGKTWVTCEFDVLGSSPHYHELMGKIRRIFDGETTATYGNDDKDRVYTALRTPWIRAGTQKMMDRMADYDQSQLGDRFQRLIISDPNNTDRRSIARSALRSERAAVMDRVSGSTSSTVDAKTRLAHALTGGYVDWLRAHAEDALARVDVPEYVEDYCIDLAELSADMRARPSEDRRKLETHNTKELPTRLARQNIRLALCLAVVLNKFSVDSEVLRIVRKVALDTAHGHSLNIAQWLCSPNQKAVGRTHQACGGLGEGALQTWTGLPPERLANYLGFLRKIDVLQLSRPAQGGNSWLLTERVRDLYTRVMRG